MSDKKRGRGRPRSERPLSKKTVRIYTDQCDLSNKEIRAAIDAGLMILSTSETADVFDNAPANEQGQIEYCQSCHVKGATLPHTCPYQEEINDSKNLCNCCDDCRQECCDDI